MNYNCNILIVGAGIGGLATALTLHELGIDNWIIIEQASAIKEVGAGVQLAPNATNILRDLGVLESIKKVSVSPQALQASDYKTANLIRDFKLGSIMHQQYGAPYLHIHRADLQKILLNSIDINKVHLGQKCISLIQSRNGIVVHTKNGDQYDANIVIGADGIHSIIREELFGVDETVFSGLLAWRGMAPAQNIRKLGIKENVNSFWGPKKHFVSYYISSGEFINWVGVAPSLTWAKESWSSKGTTDEALSYFNGWNRYVRAIIQNTAEPFKWALYDREPMEQWSSQRATLLGDAAHPMLPFMSQGAAQSIEDAYILANCLLKSGKDVSYAFDVYESIRRERAKRVQLGSRTNGEMFHLSSTPARFVRNLRFRIANYLPSSVERKKMDYLFDFNCDDELSKYYS